MAFESLSDKLQNVFKNLRGKGRLSEADVKAALKEVKMALLEADVSFRVVKQFIGSVQERAVGEDVFGSLTPGQTVIKIVTEELVKLMGSETTEISLKPSNEIMPDAGKGRHRSPLHGRVLDHHARSVRNTSLFQHLPGKTRIFSTVGGAVFHDNVFARNSPEPVGNIGQNVRLGAIGYRDGAIARIVQHRVV